MERDSVTSFTPSKWTVGDNKTQKYHLTLKLKVKGTIADVSIIRSISNFVFWRNTPFWICSERLKKIVMIKNRLISTYVLASQSLTKNEILVSLAHSKENIL